MMLYCQDKGTMDKGIFVWQEIIEYNLLEIFPILSLSFLNITYMVIFQVDIQMVEFFS